MKKIFYLFSIFFVLTNCGHNTDNKVSICCDKTYTNVDSALNCLDRTGKGNRTTAEERLLLIAFVSKDLETNQKLGWDIIKDPDIIKTAKRNYALVILDATQYKILNDSCNNYKHKDLKKHEDKTFFIIANQALCVFGDWSFGDNKESIIEGLRIGNGP